MVTILAAVLSVAGLGVAIFVASRVFRYLTPDYSAKLQKAQTEQQFWAIINSQVWDNESA